MVEIQTATRRIYEGRIISVRVDNVRLEDGREAVREVVEHPGAVAVVPVLDGRIVMVRQYRYPAGREMLEIPAGTLKAGEDPLECAKRELTEETGYRAAEMRKFFHAWLAPGYSEEQMHFFLATGLTPCQGEQDEDEHVEVEMLEVSDVLAAVREGRISDAKTAAGLLLALEILRDPAA